MLDWLLPKEFNEHEIVNNKILSGFILFTSVICFIAFLLSLIIDIKDTTPFFSIACLNIFLLLIFKYYGSRLLVGNLWIIIWVSILVPMSFHTGGIYSMDYYCLMLLPLMGFALLDYKSGLFWLFAFISFGCYLWGIIDSPEKNEFFRNQTLVFTKNYYLFGNILLSALFAGVFSIFYFQKKKLIAQLQTQQEVLSKKNNLLERQAKTIADTQAELERSNQELQEYAYVTSHDLKQPIRTVNSFATILQKQLHKKNNLDERSEEMLQFIIGGTTKMSKLVTDILDFATLKCGKEECFEALDLVQLITSIELDLKKQIEGSGVTIQKENLPIANVIPVKFNQLFQNLLSNAIKFRKKEEPLIIRIQTEDLVDCWRFSVQDNGIGIKKENLKKIFNPFKKVHNKAVYEGSGIGLASCKYIVSLHYGTIFMESIYGEGTTCYFTIPKNPATYHKQNTNTIGNGKILQQ